MNFLLDDDFIEYVFHPGTRLSQAWKNYFVNHPAKYEYAEKAKRILLGETDFFQVSQKHLYEVKDKIQQHVLQNTQS